MKIGDRVYCKKELPCDEDLEQVIKQTGHIYVKDLIQRYYTSTWFYKDKCYIISKSNSEGDLIGIIDNDGTMVLFSLSGERSRVFNMYFYTEQEMRKLKLDKINFLEV